MRTINRGIGRNGKGKLKLLTNAIGDLEDSESSEEDKENYNEEKTHNNSQSSNSKLNANDLPMLEVTNINTFFEREVLIEIAIISDSFDNNKLIKIIDHFFPYILTQNVNSRIMLCKILVHYEKVLIATNIVSRYLGAKINYQYYVKLDEEMTKKGLESIQYYELNEGRIHLCYELCLQAIKQDKSCLYLILLQRFCNSDNLKGYIGKLMQHIVQLYERKLLDGFIITDLQKALRAFKILARNKFYESTMALNMINTINKMLDQKPEINVIVYSSNPFKLYIEIIFLLAEIMNTTMTMHDEIYSLTAKLESIMLELVDHNETPDILRHWVLTYGFDGLLVLDLINKYQPFRLLQHPKMVKIVEQVYLGVYDYESIGNKSSNHLLPIFGIERHKVFGVNADEVLSIIKPGNMFGIYKYPVKATKHIWNNVKSKRLTI